MCGDGKQSNICLRALKEGRRHFSMAPHNFDYAGKSREAWRGETSKESQFRYELRVSEYAQSAAHYLHTVAKELIEKEL